MHAVLDFLSAGNSAEEILQEYPELTQEAILAALEYAAALARDEALPA